MPELPINLAALRSFRGPLPKALTDKARLTLRSDTPAENSLLTALVIAELSGDADLVPAVRSVLGPPDPESRIARYACIALQQLGDQSDDFARLALRLAQTEANVAWGLNALVSLGDRGLKFLGDWLQNRKAMKHPDHDYLAIRTLYGNSATRKLGVDAAVERCLDGPFLLEYPYDIAAEADEPALRELIIDKAFAARSFVATAPICAIEGLAKFDAMRAVEAIEIALQSHQKVERQLCRLWYASRPRLRRQGSLARR
ncbi:MAG TPA: hypothetical protein VLJ79_29295 [Candidatus Binatia bacterium]|nr:hypothetical protein [Candidatus Binatia bacterium]